MSSATSLPFGVNDTAVRTTLAAGITSTDTSVDVGEVTNPPALPFLIAVFVDQSPLREDDMEIMEVTSISGTTLTVNRGAKGTTAQGFSSGDKVFMGVLPSDFADDPALPAAEKTASPSVSVDFSVYTSGPSHGEGGSAFNGAARASDGRIVFAPRDSSNVGIFDPSSDSYTSGPSHGEGGSAFRGAARASDGRIIFAPLESSNVGIFDPSSDSYTSGPSHGEGGSAFSGAARASDGRIIFAPLESSNVGIFDPSSDSYTSGPSHGEGGFRPFSGAARAGDGRIVFAPRDSSNVGIFDPSSDSYTSGPSHGEGDFAFGGAARAGDGRIVFAPLESSNVGIFDPSSDSYTSGPSHGEEGFRAFRGAARAGDGRIVFAPRDSSNVGIFDPSSDSYTSGPSHGEGDFAFGGAARAGDGRIVFAPRQSSSVGISGSVIFTKDTVSADLSSQNIIHVTRGGDGPIEIDALTFDDGRRAVTFVSVENAGEFDFSVIVDSGGGTFKWSGAATPTLGSGSGVVNVIGLKQTGRNEVTGFAVEQ